MAITNLDHVVVATSDLEAATATWQGNFGLPLEATREVAALGIRQAVLPIGSAFVELITPLGEEGPVAGFLKERGEGLYLISLAVDDLDATIAALREKGVRVGDPVSGGSGSRIAFISARQSNGVTLPLVERGTRAD